MTPHRRVFCQILLWSLLLGIHKGYIALWNAEDPEPKAIFPYKAASLPPEAYRRLEQGIVIKDSLELEKLLEDYLS